MIPRYAIPEIEKIWSDEMRFQKMFDVEMAVLKALENHKMIPTDTHLQFKNIKINPARIREIETQTRHDVIAFCTSITEQVPPEIGKFFHYGVTSSDILDTALSLQLRDSLTFLCKDLEKLISVLDARIDETKDLLCLGRSHGMAAEPMIFAQKFLSSQCEFKRRLQDYRQWVDQDLTGLISGAVGNYSVLSPSLESTALKELNLSVEPISTQVLPRDRLAKIISIGALTASALERLSTELRLLSHSDVAEVQEGFSSGQKGSSTMPHKKNPISSENITGLSRVIRSHLDIALENIVLWHERDISHSSTERLYLPDHFGLLSYSIRRLAETVQNLVIQREFIEKKVREKFVVLSSLVLHELIQKTDRSREDLYNIVQKASFQASNYEDWIRLIQKEVSAHHEKIEFKGMDWISIRSKYIQNFSQIRKRS